MSETDRPSGEHAEGTKTHGCLLPLAVILIFAVAGLFWVRYNFYAPFFSPTRLSPQEERSLEVKLDQLQGAGTVTGGEESDELKPYTEEGLDRSIRLTEKELNSLVAEDEETAKRVALKLSDDLVTIRFIAPIDEDFPLFGGRTLRLKAGVKLAYRSGRPVVVLRGVSLGGVPLPNAWLGNLKNINLVGEFGDEEGFWKIFADGVDDIEVREGYVRISLRE